MGILIGKFKKKTSTYDILEKLEKEIDSIEEFGRKTELYRKKIITRFILLALFVYFLLACILYFYYNPNQKWMYILILIASPFIFWLIKKFLAWYYSRKLHKNEKKLVKLKEEKKKILDNVMETETYKVAKNILDKFGNEKKQQQPIEQMPSSAILSRQSTAGLRQRQSFAGTQSFKPSFGTTPKSTFDGNRMSHIQNTFLGPQGSPLRLNTAIPSVRKEAVSVASPQITGTPLPLPRDIVPSNRNILDKMVDYLVGDGPSNRYALICNKCSNHNGMALKEEFEYLSFRCCYCSNFNPARKKKPSGPKFETQNKMKITQLDDSSDSDKDTPDSDSDLQRFRTTEERRSSSDVEVSQKRETLNNSSQEDTNNIDTNQNKTDESKEEKNLKISKNNPFEDSDYEESPMDVEEDKDKSKLL